MTTDSFAGSTCELNLIVDYDSMHAGKNYGKVTLSTPYQKLCIEVTAEKHTQSELCPPASYLPYDAEKAGAALCQLPAEKDIPV